MDLLMKRYSILIVCFTSWIGPVWAGTDVEVFLII